MTTAWCHRLLVACLLLPPLAAGAEPIKLRITTQLPITHHIGVNLQQFKTEVEGKSDRAISVEIFASARLYKDDQALGAVASGAIEMGVVSVPHFREKAPAVELVEVPFLFNFEALVRAGTHPDSEIRTLLDEAVLKATGARVLWWQSVGSSVVFAKGQDARTPAAISGKKIRVAGDGLGGFIRACGGIPVVVLAGKQKQAIEDGTIDMTITGIAGVTARELWKATDTITRTDNATLEFLVIINDKVWQSLSGEHKGIVRAAARKADQDLRQKMADIEAKAYALAREKRMTIHDLTPDDVAEWRACSAGSMEDYLNLAGELGWRAMAAYGKLRTDPCCSAGPKGEFTRR